MSAYQHDNHFTLDEARALIPWLRETLTRIIGLFTRMADKGFDPIAGQWSPRGNGHSEGPPPDEYDELLELVAEVDGRGVLIKDFENGVVDFPHLLPDGEEVYLCWMMEEPTISFWHRIPDGFMGRVPLEEKDEDADSP